MLIKLLKAKIHNATVTGTRVDYHGSITIDSDLLKASGLLVNESVLVADADNGNRFQTYIIPGPAGSGRIEINGAAARLSKEGHRVIIMSFVLATPEETREHISNVVIVDEHNRVKETAHHRSAP